MKRSFFLVAVLLLVAGPLATADEPSLLTRALEAFKAGKYKEVVALATKVPAESGDRARARYLLGEAQLRLAKPKEAEAAFREVLATRPKAVPAIVGLGRAREAQKDDEAAEKLYRDAVKLDAKDAAARRALGELQLRLEKVGKARTTLRAAYKLAPKDPFCARALVRVLLTSGDDRGAEKVATAFVKARPDHPMGHFLHGVVLERRKKVSHAAELYERALALDAKFLDAHKNLAIFWHTNNPEYKDLDLVRKALDHYEAYFMLGGSDDALKQTWRQFQRFAYGVLNLEDEDDDDDDKDDKDDKDDGG